jgi:hypothetical protein
MNNDTAASVATMLVAGLALFLMVLWISTAAPAAVCLTKQEARELWPKQHIYWYSKDRCWSNRRGPPRNLKMDPIRNSLAQAKKEPAPPERVYRWDEYNPIDAMADREIFFEPKPFPLWRSISVWDPYVFADLWAVRINGAFPPDK